MAAPPLRHLTIDCRDGSRQHFYHFFFGVLLPLGRYLSGTGDALTPLVVEGCGPMDTILEELDLRGLVLVPRKKHQRLAKVMPPALAACVTLAPFDIDEDNLVYDPGAIRAGAGWVLARLQDRVEAQRRALLADWSSGPRILVIDRGPPDPFYATARSEKKKAGAQRRRIGNHDEVIGTISSRFPGCRNTLLEGQTLAAQIALFQLADIVIAQHGAALSNIVWMRPEARIIELEGGASPTGHFTRLAAALGLSHRFFPQEGRFGSVDAGALTAVVAGLAEDLQQTPSLAGAGPGVTLDPVRTGSGA